MINKEPFKYDELLKLFKGVKPLEVEHPSTMFQRSRFMFSVVFFNVLLPNAFKPVLVTLDATSDFERTKEIFTEPEDTAYKFMNVNSRMCPSNWFRSGSTLVIDGDTDPHGALKPAILIPEGVFPAHVIDEMVDTYVCPDSGDKSYDLKWCGGQLAQLLIDISLAQGRFIDTGNDSLNSSENFKICQCLPNIGNLLNYLHHAYNEVPASTDFTHEDYIDAVGRWFRVYPELVGCLEDLVSPQTVD